MVTRIGNGGNDTLVGTDGDDALYGRGGADLLKGLAGNDGLYGQGGDDTLAGGPGDDRLDGGAGHDIADYRDQAAYPGDSEYGIDVDFAGHKVVTGDGQDTLVGIERVDGSAFNDHMLGGPDADTAYGNQGNDDLQGRGGDDYLVGGLGADVLYGDAGTRTPGDDQLFGGDGGDQLHGNEGNDVLIGGKGDDSLEGGAGDDVLIGGPGRDHFAFEDEFYHSGQDHVNGTQTIADFVRGQDDIGFFVGDPQDGPSISFHELDSNGNGVLDAGDKYVSIRDASYDGHAARSTVVDVSAFAGHKEVLVVYGVTGLTGADFGEPSGGAQADADHHVAPTHPHEHAIA
jgi:Ca2+-binding RTX toxin-like protein